MEQDAGENGECAVCRTKTSLKCGNCRGEFYCNKSHQREGWSRHKTICQAWEVCESRKLGRYLVATRDLEMDDLIVSEAPVIWGPAPYHLSEDSDFMHYQRACVGCGKQFNNFTDPQRCPLCIWPACRSDCEGLTDRNRHGLECPYLQRVRIIPRFDILLALRMLIHWRMNSKRWTILSKLQSHVESRVEGTDSHEEVLAVARQLSPFIAVEPAAADVLPKICGLIDVNALDVSTPESSVAIYETACLLEHSCIANTRHSFSIDDKGRPRIIVKACRTIKKGEHLTTMYTHALWATRVRREHLLSTKYFECTCERCADPTELGSHIGTLKCPCNNGLILPKNPLDRETEWSCNVCPAILAASDVAQLTDRLEEDVEQAMKAPKVEALWDLLSRLVVLLHPGHQHCTSVGHSLIQLLPADDSRKLELCRRIVKTVTTLDPYGTRLALHAAVALRELASCPGEDTKELLTKAVSLLKNEASNTPGGKLQRFLKSELSSL